MKSWMIFVAFGSPCLAVLAWSQTQLPAALTVIVPGQGVHIPQIDHAGAQAAVAYTRLGRFAPPEIADSETAVPDAAVVSEESIEQIFRRNLSAVVGEGPEVQLVLSSINKPGERKYYRVGQEFQDGWRIAEILPQSIRLKKSGLFKEISLFGFRELPPPPDPARSSEPE